MRMILLLHAISALFFTNAAQRDQLRFAKPGCPDKCGNVSIPYPFGIGTDCSANSSFTVLCQNTANPPKPFLSSNNLEVTEFSLDENIVKVMYHVPPLNCSTVQTRMPLGKSLQGSPFTISSFYNRLAVVGCQLDVELEENQTVIYGSCNPGCGHVTSSKITSQCNGINCCQIAIPPRLQQLQIIYSSSGANNNTYCGYVFPVDSDWFNDDIGKEYDRFSNVLSSQYNTSIMVPIAIMWEIDVENIKTSPLASCQKSSYDDVIVNQCHCRSGFEGNPYLEMGCQDIDECNHPTVKYCRETCINTWGSFKCENSKGMARTTIAFITVASGLGTLALLLGGWQSKNIIKKRINKKCRQKFFKRNGGLLLEQQMSFINHEVQNTILFSSEELELATDKFNRSRILGHGGQGTVYKGMLVDGRIVAVKKSKKIDEVDLQVFINEIIILSQLNHRNVVKLLGCCLETEVPILVYEFVPNGTLFQHIHEPNEEFSLSWKMRIRISREVAGALCYMHSAASFPIFHRDIKSTNILLDDKYQAKVSDFGTSRSVAIDQTHVTTRVLGTFGYLDPEYFRSGHFTDKSDVYSFGVVLIELLTGEKAVSSVREEQEKSLVTYFLRSMDENHLHEILDVCVLLEGKEEEVFALAELARQCLHLDGKQRPTMKEVVRKLEIVLTMIEDSQFNLCG